MLEESKLNYHLYVFVLEVFTLIFMSYETHMFRSVHIEEFLYKQIIVINCSHNTTVNEQ